MSVATESTESLKQRRAALDYLMMNYAMSGTQAPESEAKEFAAIQDELARREREGTIAPGEGSRDDRPRSWTSWLGLTIGEYRLVNLISDGNTALVMRGEKTVAGHPEATTAKFFKIARDQAVSDSKGPITANKRSVFATQSLHVAPFQLSTVIPNCDEVMLIQAERLLQAKNAGGVMVSVEESSTFEGREYYRMPELPGEPLRKIITEAEDRLPTLASRLFLALNLLETLHRLQTGLADASGEHDYHGDIKPDNIMIDGQQITLIDPGYFGTLLCQQGEVPFCMISTPLYYPLLEADDKLAAGFMMWELIAGVHPLAPGERPRDKNAKKICYEIGASLQDLINFRSSLLQPYLMPLLEFETAESCNPDITPPLADWLLRCIGLQRGADGRLEIKERFVDFAEMASALSELGLI